MELVEAIKLLKEMQDNCKNKTTYKDEKAEAKSEAIEVVFKELDKRGYIIKNIIDVLVQEGFIKKRRTENNE